MTLSVCLKRAQASVATLPVQIPRDRCTGNLAARQHAVALTTIHIAMACLPCRDESPEK